jgi:signal transduction histidine kinase
LRPAALEEFGLSMAIQTLVQETEAASNLKVSCSCQLEKTNLSEEAEVTLYRIAQEGLTNVLRHAQASQVQLSLQQVEEGIQLSIEDDGIGFDPQHLPDRQRMKHLGLVSMRERAAMLGGSLDVYTAPGKGTYISIIIPTTEVINGNLNHAG